LESKVRDRTLEIQRKNMEILEKEKAIYETQHSLAQAQMKNMMLEKEKLANDLVYKSQELTGYTLHLAQKNAVLEALRAQIEELKGTTPDQEIVRKLNRMVRQIDFNLNRYEEWERFRMAFESVHKDFFTVMKKRYKGLTSKDLRLCALLKINFSTNEIASILGISARSVNVARYRLRKKLQVSHDEKLLDLLMAV
jgi:DNA-binding CsgD family transcriptional regulator